MPSRSSRLMQAMLLWLACVLFAVSPPACVEYTLSPQDSSVQSDDSSSGNTVDEPSTPDNTTPAASHGSTADPDVTDPCILVGQPASPIHQQMFEALNDFRVSKGLAKLRYSKVLEKAANAHALDMYTRDFFDHINPDGDGPLERALDAGFCRVGMIGENIAWNYPTVADVQTGWENSPHHYENMALPEFTLVGMGYFFSANGPYYVQLFGDVFDEP